MDSLKENISLYIVRVRNITVQPSLKPSQSATSVDAGARWVHDNANALSARFDMIRFILIDSLGTFDLIAEDGVNNVH